METEVLQGWKGVTGAGMTCPASFSGLSETHRPLAWSLHHPFVLSYFSLSYSIIET